MQNINEFAIIGFGNQAKAWALNLRDSGYRVFIGLRPHSNSIKKAQGLGFEVFDLENSEVPTSSFALLTPDDQHKKTLSALGKKNSNKNCLYAHGYSVSKLNIQTLFPHFNHILLAPKSIASELRFLYETRGNLTAFYSLEYSSNFELSELREISSALGISNIFPTCFLEETQADLFSEQSILCSLIPYGILETYNTLIEKNYSKELAFFECFYESKLIIDTIFKVGPKEFFKLISPNALIGSEVGRDLLLGKQFKNKLATLLQNIEDNNFQEHIEQTDIQLLRLRVNEFWESQSLDKTYNKLKDFL